MKNRLLYTFSMYLSKRKNFQMAVFAVLIFFSAQQSFAQITYTWGGGTSTDFLTDTNWSPAGAVFTSATNSFTIPSGTTNSPVLGSDYPSASNTCAIIVVNTGATLTTNGNITTSTNTNTINGTLNVGAGIFKSRLYIGNSAASAAVVNVANGATLSGVGVWRISFDATPTTSGTLNVNGGTYEMASGSSLSIGGVSAARKGILNVNSGLVKFTGTATLSLGAAGTTATGTLNLAGGLLEYNAVNFNNGGITNITGGSFKMLNTVGTTTINASSATTPGVINVAGGTFETSGPLTIGSTTTGTVTVNVNSGTMNVAGALSVLSTAVVNIDAGSIVLDGDQTSAIAALVTAGRINVSGAALIAGKTISNTYNAGTNKTTVLASAASTTWTGTWSNGTPTATTEAIIEAIYSTATNGTFTAKKLTVNSGSLTINTLTNLTVQDEVINNAGENGIVIENNANLIQVNTATNVGNVVVNRNSNALSRLDYTMWSSPVASQNLATFSPLTSQSPSRFYTYDSTTNLYSTVASPTTTNFTAGTGYLIRMPNTAVIAPDTETFAGQFTGVPNNGAIGFSGLTSGLFYAVGNPYPSTISAESFLAANATDGVLYFWRKTNGAGGSAYATYTAGGATSTTPSSVAPNGTIQVGQGFIVKTGTEATTLNFTNAMRTANTDNQIFRTKAVQKNRVWLNLTNTTGVFSQALVGYIDGATQGVDAFDGKYINDSPIALTSVINGEEYTIQGRPAFDTTDVVALNFKTDVDGDYTIAIDHTDGLFAAGQDVYLVDSATGTETNLKTDAYTFTATTGTAASRFSLKYQKTLGVNAPAFNENNVAVYKNNGTLYVNSGANAISNIKVFDIQGRLIAEQKNVNANSAAIKNIKANQQVLIVKVTSQDNKVVNKKVVN